MGELVKGPGPHAKEHVLGDTAYNMVVHGGAQTVRKNKYSHHDSGEYHIVYKPSHAEIHRPAPEGRRQHFQHAGQK